MRRVALALVGLVSACTPAQLAGLQAANTVATGVACGVAAANQVPCTPAAAVEALTTSQRALSEALAQAAARGDGETIQAILAQLATCSESERKLTEALAAMAARAAATSSAPATTDAP